MTATMTPLQSWEHRTARDVGEFIARYLREHKPPAESPVAQNLEQIAELLSGTARRGLKGGD